MDIKNQILQKSTTGDDAFRLLIESAIDTAILTFDCEGRLTSWSTGAQRIMGYSESEILGQSGYILFTPEDRANRVPELEMQKALKQGRADDQRWHLRRDGRRFFANGAMTPLRDEEGNVVGFTKVMRDDTARKQAEDALRASEARFRTLFDQTTAGMVQADLSGRNILVNEQLCRILGYSRDELLQMRLHDITHSDDLPDCAAKFDQLISQGTPFEMEKRYQRKNGSYAWISATISAVCDEAGKPQSVCAVIVDVSARKHAEVALSTSEERYHTLFDSMAEGFCVIEMMFDSDEKPYDYRFLEANAAFERLTGLKDVVGKRVRVLLPQLGPHWFEIYGQVALSGQPVRLENMGSVLGRQYEILAYPYGASESRQVAIIFNDITQRKQAEAALAESEERLRAIISQATVGISLSNLEGKIIFANQRLFEILGRSDGELQDVSIADITHPKDREESLELFQRMVTSGQPFIIEKRYLRPDGLIVWVSCNVSLIRNAEGQPHSAMAVVLDITERKQAEVLLRQGEERHRIALEAAEMGTWDWNVESGRMTWNPYHFNLLGLEPQEGEVSFAEFLCFIHPDDRASVEAKLARALDDLEVYKAEYRITRADTGEVCWISSYGRTVEHSAGRVTRMMGVIFDSTERKTNEAVLQRANEELEARVRERTASLNAMTLARRQLLRQLVTAQEEEQARISHDLHDQLGQHLAILILELNNLKAMGLKPEAQDALQDAITTAHEFGQETHRIAASLRPTALDDLGLPAALENLVGRWAVHSRIQADFECVGFDERRLPSELETTIYRVTQEALTNILRHGKGATLVSVVVQWGVQNVRVLIEDNGSGFDVEGAMNLPHNQRRLGLFGMRERAEVVGGTLDVESQPGTGTTVVLQVPAE